MSFEPGDVVEDKYRIVRTIGAGGMGAVYEGVNVRIGRRVAIKVMHGEASKVPDLRRRFAREARVAAKIGSANICDVLDLGDLPDGSSYLVMEYLVGESLDDRITARVRMPASEIALIALQLLDGLSAMHGAGIVHRDLKPANIFLTSPSLRTTGEGREVVKILDFGISKFQTQLDGDEAQTATGTLMGTPLYMSPEQSRGVGDLDGRSDLYCVGVILYRALAGDHCFEAANIPQLLFKTAIEPPIPLLPRVEPADHSFVPIVEKAMAKAPDDRYQTARELRDAIEAWLLAEHPMELLPPAAAHLDGLVLGGSGSYPNVVVPSATAAITPQPLSASGSGPVVAAAAAANTGSAWEKKVSGEVSALAASLAPAASAATIASPGSQPELTTAPPSVHTPAPSQPPAGARRGPRLAVAGVAAALALALVAVGVQRTTASGATAPPPSAGPSVPSAAPKPSEAPPQLASAASAAPAASAASAAPAASAAATGAPSAEVSAAPATPKPPAAAHAAATKPGPAAATPVAVTPPPAAPSASAKPGRKIRTEL
ncbi:MAG: protein kinase [Myxococcales bacterium]|nr:protein kinase [Myxococcales bacterium]